VKITVPRFVFICDAATVDYFLALGAASCIFLLIALSAKDLKIMEFVDLPI
jgi:hypothetical protein